MRTFIYLSLISLILLGNFFCSGPFDDETSLGSSILNDQDSLITIFDGKICEALLAIDSAKHFVDTDSSGSQVSGLNKFTPLAIGTWGNLSSIAFFKFNADSLQRWVNYVDTCARCSFHSLAFTFSNDNSKSDSIAHASIEIGFCNNKSDSVRLDRDHLWEIAHYSYNSGIAATHRVVINEGYIGPADTVIDTTTYRFRARRVRVRTFTSDTIMYPKDTTVYDSITPLLSLISDSQSILYTNTLDYTVADTAFHWDTVITAPETSTVYTINTKLVHIINGQDTTEFLQYDTTAMTTTISQDSLVQFSTISPRISLTKHFSTADQWDLIIDTVNDTTFTVKNLCLYARLDSITSNSLQFIKNIQLDFTYLKTNTKDSTKMDTVHSMLVPSPYDYSVFESAVPPDSPCVSSGAAGRYTMFELNLQPIRDMILDSAGNILFNNIPKADVTILPYSFVSHKSIGDTVYVRYVLSTTKTTNIDAISHSGDDALFRRSQKPLTATTTSLNIQLNTFLIDLLYETGSVPEKCYLYLWLSNAYFTQVYWHKPDTGLSISFIVSNSP